jgi:hypothetical protein
MARFRSQSGVIGHMKDSAYQASVDALAGSKIAARKASTSEQQMIAASVMRKSVIIYDDEHALRMTGTGKGLVYDPHAEDYHGHDDPGKPIGYVSIKNGVGAGWINGKFDDFNQRPDNPYPNEDFAEINPEHYAEYAKMLTTQSENERLTKLAKTLDDITYEVDSYSYADNLTDTYDSVDEMRAHGMNLYLEDLKKDEKGTVKTFLNEFDCEESIESLTASGATEQLKALEQLREDYKEKDICASFGGDIAKYGAETDVKSGTYDEEYQ